MAKNNGKQFEVNFKDSIPDYVWKYRPPDSGGGMMARFTSTSICDLIAYNSKNKIMTLFELKSTVGTSFSFRNKQDVIEVEKAEEEFKRWQLGQSKENIKAKRAEIRALRKELDKSMIKYHQIMSLYDATNFGASAYLVFTLLKADTTYAIHILDFIDFWESTTKKSINEKDIQNIIEISEKSHKIESEFAGRSKINKSYKLDILF